MVGEAETLVRAEFGSAIFGEGDDELEAVVVRLLTEKKQTLSLAESCTGGGIADRLTNVPGASAVFLGGFVTYSNETKEKMLGVRRATLVEQGAVSEAVAREMADGARRATGSDYAIAVTGIAGPAGGTPEKPMGTVFIALASDRSTHAWKLFNPWDRLAFKEITARQAINLLRLRLLA
jgi:nicotinamide-nucleotide amidase